MELGALVIVRLKLGSRQRDIKGNSAILYRAERPFNLAAELEILRAHYAIRDRNLLAAKGGETTLFDRSNARLLRDLDCSGVFAAKRVALKDAEVDDELLAHWLVLCSGL